MSTKKSGIYFIRNVFNDRMYVGGTVNLQHRKRQHFSDLRLHKHGNPRLQKDYDLFGEDAFYFVILEEIDQTEKEHVLVEREQFWMDELRPEYNVNEVAGKYIGDYIRTPEALEKRNKSGRGWKHTDKWKQDQQKWMREHPVDDSYKSTDEFKDKIRQLNLGANNPMYGTHRSEETKKKSSEHRKHGFPGVVSPDGVVYPGIKHLGKFCSEHSLGYYSMSNLLNGKCDWYKGWTRLDVVVK